MTRIATTLALLSLTAAPFAAQSHYTLNPTGTEARYQVRELLAANTIENDVVGKTAGRDRRDRPRQGGQGGLLRLQDHDRPDRA